MTEIERIQKLYVDGLLDEVSDESGAEGYWDLAGEIASELVDAYSTPANSALHEQLQTGIYGVFQTVLVRDEKYLWT